MSKLIIKRHAAWPQTVHKHTSYITL